MRRFRTWIGTLAFALFSFAWTFLLQVWSVIVGREPANFHWSSEIVASVFPFGIGVIYLAPIVLLSLRPKKHFALRIGIFILVSIIVKMFGSSSMYIPGFIAFAAVTSLFVLALGYLGVSEAFWWYVTAYWLAISGGFWIAVASGSVIARFDSPSQWWLIILIQITIMFLLAAIAAKANGRVPTDTMVKLAIFTFVCLLLPYVYLVSGVPADRL